MQSAAGLASGRQGREKHLDSAVGRQGSGRTCKRALQAERIQVQGRNGSAGKVLRELPKADESAGGDQSCVREPGDYRYERIPNGGLQQEGGRSQAEPAPIRGGSRHQGKRKERIRGVQAMRQAGRQPRGRREIQHVYACGCARA